MRRQGLDSGDELTVPFQIYRFVLSVGGRRSVTCVRPNVINMRSNRSIFKATTAIGADVFEHRLNAVRTEGALKAADFRVC